MIIIVIYLYIFQSSEFVFCALVVKMACANGGQHTIILSDDGTVHTFGHNCSGQLGLGSNKFVPNAMATMPLPTPIPTLSKIKQISCGYYFTVCVDHEGFMWSFGENNTGQLGTGNKTNLFVPQKIQEIPPVLSVSCGYAYTLIITNDSDLWSCGNNNFGQLCLKSLETQYKPQKSSFSNILKISAGQNHSLFQNNEGEIFACGENNYGQCASGRFSVNQGLPTLIHNLPSNIVHFICGLQHNLFLDLEGNVYSVGYNYYGSLGLGHNTKQNVLNKIPNIPPIKVISCVNSSSYLIDFDGNVWSFGYNSDGQLGHGDKTNRSVPTKIESLTDIQQISSGSCGNHFLAKDSQNTIFGTGANFNGQLGTKNPELILTPKEIDSKYFEIWGNALTSRGKSARK